MGDSEAYSVDEGDFEVLDECGDGENSSANEDTTKDVEQTSANFYQETEEKNVKNFNSNQDEKTNTMQSKEIPVIKIDDEKDSTMSFETSKNKDSIDFSADISIEQLNDQDVIDNLNEIENIVFDSVNFGVQSKRMEAADLSFIPLSIEGEDQSMEINDEIEETAESSDVIVLEQSSKIEETEKSTEVAWYEEKLKTKVDLVKERFSKLSRVLKYSYPSYAKHLDKIEEKIGSPVCKLDTPRRCPLIEPYINRWKFVCTRKPVEESAESNKEGDTSTVDKNVETIWRLEPYEGTVVNTNNAFQKIPTFVMHSVKIFEDFINSSINNQSEDDADGIQIVEEKLQKPPGLDTTNETNENTVQTNIYTEEQWLWVLIRSNRKKELMIFATGRNLSDSTIDGLKQLFESGQGKDCNVKSLYCKSMMRVDNVSTSNTTFLVGSEALDEDIGSLKIQLAPKTNFWLSTAGAEQLARTVEKFLIPTRTTTILDVGCGLGLLGLTMASKCHQVIGMDSVTEVEEAEMTCDLNNITNASFVMGEPAQVMASISTSLPGSKSFAIVNANTAIGRNIEVMTGLRKILTLRRIIMVTTLTKQSVRSILELARPASNILGEPFLPTRAVIVDTLPTGPQFEVVIRMERRSIQRLCIEITDPESAKQQPKKYVKNVLKKASPREKSASTKNIQEISNKKSVPSKKQTSPGNKPSGKAGDKTSPHIPPKKLVKNPYHEKVHGKSWQHNKHSHSSRPPVDSRSSRHNDRRISPPYRKRNEVIHVRSVSPKDSRKRKYDWDDNGSARGSSGMEKKPRDHDDDLRKRLSNTRNETDLIQKMKEQQKILEVAKRKLTDSSVIVDSFTAKQVQDMLDAAIQQTNQIQSQLPRSVWDRIAPPDHNSTEITVKDESMLKGRYVEKLAPKDIVITTSNQSFDKNRQSSEYRKYPNAKILEPNLIMPIDEYIIIPSHDRKVYQKSESNDRLWDLDENRWAQSSSSQRSDPRKYDDYSVDKRKAQSPPRRPFSPVRRQFSPRQTQSPFHPRDIEIRRQISPPRHYSPPPRPSSATRFITTPPRRDMMQRPSAPIPMRQTISPRRIRGQSSPTRPSSPMRFGDDWDIPSRNAIEQQTNWQRTFDNRQSTQWNLGTSLDKFRNPNNQDLIWDVPTGGNSNWNASGSGGGGGGDAWNNKQMSNAKPQGRDQWSPIMPENRFSGLNNDNWAVRGKEPINKANHSRNNDSWNDNNKQRWEPQQNKNWNQDKKEDWNDLPEDARDPWGDDGGLGGKERWQKFDNPSQTNWNRDCEQDWSSSKDNWQNKGPLMNVNSIKPQWQGNVGNNMGNHNQINNSRWANEASKNNQPPGIWQQNNNNAWRSNFPGGFQPSRNFNSNAFTDGR